MSLDYFEVASLAFGSSSFTTRELASRTGSARPAKILSELKMRGLAERLGRGEYRLLGPAERPDLRSVEWKRVRRLLLDAGLPMAWTGPTAIEVWTGGRYRVSPSVYLREFHISFPRNSEAAWREYLRSHRVSTDPARRIGSKAVLYPTESFRRVTLSGDPVIPRREALALIRGHRAIYANADRLVKRGS